MARSTESFGRAPESMLADTRLSPSARLVYAAISCCCRGRDYAAITHHDIALLSGLGATAIKAATKILRDTDWLHVRYSPGQPPTYTLSPNRGSGAANLTPLPYVGGPSIAAKQGEGGRENGGGRPPARYENADIEREKERGAEIEEKDRQPFGSMEEKGSPGETPGSPPVSAAKRSEEDRALDVQVAQCEQANPNFWTAAALTNWEADVRRRAKERALDLVFDDD